MKLPHHAVFKLETSRIRLPMRIATTLLLLLLSYPGFSQNADPISAGNFSTLDRGRSTLDEAAAPDFLPVEDAYQLALEIIDDQQLRLYWRITDGYYLYRKRFSFSLEDDEGEIEITPRLPQGITREDEYFGISEVYYTHVDVYLDLARTSRTATLKITSQGCADAGLCYPPQRQKFSVDFDQGTIGAISKKASTGSQSTRSSPEPASFTVGGLLYMMLLAFVGGSILNLMPCVFPVLSLKVFSFATGSEHTKHVHGWVYAGGVVSSFLLVGLLLITLQHAGAAVGWGFQLQSPRFVALLAYLFFAMGLSLSGLVEIGTSIMGAGGQLADRGGYSGSFFTGVLATVVASPCTAPFMGAALGFAVTQPAPIALSVFVALGSGMAAPMLLLSYSTRLRSLMPRPGPWMETFKQVLAFPLYATAIWLLWVSGRQTSVTAMALLLCGMLALALGLWLWRYRGWGKVFATASVLLAFLVIPSAALESSRGVDKDGTSAGFSQQQLDQLLQSGDPVFVNVTADWCITCIANERTALGADEVEQAMESLGVHYLVVDWTNYDAGIAAFLAQHGRNGVPLYLVYSGRPGEAPQILPQLLTTGIILEAFEKIGSK
jgi:thiol:disulfide interchange protein DsbD